MSTIHTENIGTVASLGPGAIYNFQWNNPPWNTVLSYFAYPVPIPPVGPHGSHVGSVRVSNVTCTSVLDHGNGDRKYVTIEITNTGSEATGFELFQSWVA